MKNKGGIVLEHLSIEEMLLYVTAKKIDDETLSLLSKVNGHIRTCKECKERVEAFQVVNDEIERSAALKVKESVENTKVADEPILERNI